MSICEFAPQPPLKMEQCKHIGRIALATNTNQRLITTLVLAFAAAASFRGTAPCGLDEFGKLAFAKWADAGVGIAKSIIVAGWMLPRKMQSAHWQLPNKLWCHSMEP